jgi:hypothetical protein
MDKNGIIGAMIIDSDGLCLTCKSYSIYIYIYLSYILYNYSALIEAAIKLLQLYITSRYSFSSIHRSTFFLSAKMLHCCTIS